MKRWSDAARALARLVSPPSRELPLLFLALSVLLEAGMDLAKSLECATALTEPDYPALARSLRGISRKLRDGASVPSAFSAYSLHFSPFHRSLIQTGDKTGKLSEVFSALAIREEDWYVTLYRIYSALTYPILMCVLVLVMVLVVVPWTVTEMLPLVAGNGPLPSVTQWLLLICQAMRSWQFWVVMGFLGWMVLRALNNSVLRERLLAIVHRAPVLGNALKATACQAFFHALHLQIQAGLDLYPSLRSAADVSGNRLIQQSIKSQSDLFKAGEIDLVGVFEAFDPMVSQSIVTLQETGEAGRIFPVLAQFYQDQMENTLEKVLSLLNPLLTLLMGCIIGVVVIATALPIVRMADSL